MGIYAFDLLELFVDRRISAFYIKILQEYTCHGSLTTESDEIRAARTTFKDMSYTAFSSHVQLIWRAYEFIQRRDQKCGHRWP